MTQVSRRRFMAGTLAVAGTVAAPTILRAQTQPIILGHLTPRTGNFQGTWPTVWTHQVQTDASQAFVQNFMKKHNKMPKNQAWSDYVATRILAQAIAETGGTDTDTLITFLESGAAFDILKHRKGHFNKDHQLLGEMYTVTALESAQVKDEWNVFTTSDPVPGSTTPLEVLTQNPVGGVCNLV